ncbi:MAG TPA: alpha/beta fold hydrolase [Ktedonobacterales bacterium]
MAADARVQTAIVNWAPRFLANGIDPSDFQRVTARIATWADWIREWSACGDMHRAMGEEAERLGEHESMAYHFFHAAMAYHFAKFLAVEFPEQLRAAHDLAVASYARALPWFDVPGERMAIPYEDGLTMWGILRKPAHVARPPVVILVPGLDSVKEELHTYADEFLRRGMATLAIDGPGQGEMEFERPMRSDYEVVARAAIDALERRDDLDVSRVGMLGVSLGGYYAPRAAAFEPRIRAVIALAGPYAVAEAFDAMPSLTQEAFIHRSGAVSTADAVERLRPFTLAGALQRLTAPLLVIMGRQDRVIPPHDAERVADEAGGPVTLWMFDEGNHVCNNIPFKHRPQMADWMRRTLSDSNLAP